MRQNADSRLIVAGSIRLAAAFARTQNATPPGTETYLKVVNPLGQPKLDLLKLAK